MKTKFFLAVVLVCICQCFAGAAIAASAMTSRWTSPNAVTKDDVFNAVLSAGAEAKFSMVSNDRIAGLVFFRQERPGSHKKNYESLLNVRIQQEGDKVGRVWPRQTVGGRPLNSIVRRQSDASSG